MSIDEIIDVACYCCACLGFSTGLFFWSYFWDVFSRKD